MVLLYSEAVAAQWSLASPWSQKTRKTHVFLTRPNYSFRDSESTFGRCCYFTGDDGRQRPSTSTGWRPWPARGGRSRGGGRAGGDPSEKTSQLSLLSLPPDKKNRIITAVLGHLKSATRDRNPQVGYLAHGASVAGFRSC
ncbi:hypothetical protein EVAR_74411_1 [Eumeta japonica]|uniref:Uncharacterized protein n=1 Tax=Eumeta variegata TaxID=151549 RepID=A0A4C1SDF2_EUMVA|nr:hypothetical protein EVAR_74411_1 [Eumeta japonica]